MTLIHVVKFFSYGKLIGQDYFSTMELAQKAALAISKGALPNSGREVIIIACMLDVGYAVNPETGEKL